MAGLGIGIASFLLLFLYVYNDLTYNHFNKNLANIYRVYEGNGAQTKGLLLPKMQDEIPEVKNGTRIFDWDGFRMSYKNLAFPENIQYADTGFFSVFTFPFIEGSAKPGIKDKYGVVISKEFAEKYFGDKPAIGKKIRVKFDNTFLHVNGVVDIPSNSSVKFNILASYETGETISPWIKGVHDWYNTFSNTYVLLENGVKPASIQNKLQRIVHENFLPVGKNKTKLNLVPFKDYHAKEESNRTMIIILTVIALGILSIAVVNFINLTITSSLSRIKETGIKKMFGASRKQLIIQMLTESLMVSFVALLLGGLITTLTLPYFNQLFGTRLHFNPLQNPILLLILAAIWLVIGIVSGTVPALFMAKAKLTNSIRGSLSSVNKAGTARYSLLIVQFVIAIVLIAGTVLIRKQISFMMNKDTKFDKENVVVADLETWQYQDMKAASQKFKVISEELQASPYVESVCFSNTIPGTYNQNYNTFYTEEGKGDKNIRLRKAYVGKNYFKTYGIKVLDGSGFDQDLTNYKNCMILNKTAINKLGFKGATDQLMHESSPTGDEWKVIGEVDDFSYQGAQNKMQPLAHFFTQHDNLADWNYLSVKAKPGAALQVIALMKKEWKKIPPLATANYFFANDKLNDYYKEYIKVNQLIAWFSVLAIMLSILGLFALSSYMMTRRVKEIGIRKVNGAKVSEVMSMLNKDFVKWVAIAFVIATPIAWFALNKWLENFANRTSLSWWIFALAGILALGIALLTVSWQSWKAATRNPVEALRYE
ncbi:ABC transporter permease [Prolixibacter bellariivorans]|uniref:ABC transporter permease n=2 Tax=Prolixibacter bellariivorans TaxID=314319 RepID=A0A5M4B2M3_9BACT|nr:ABC transporter permease [Prolixibacter bellariivorans]GET34146.1 ABC transporter permease [Prolixibacter bellariivorans]